MALIEVILILIAVGVLLWVVNTYLAPYIWTPFLKIINVVAIIATIIWLLNLFVPLDSLFHIHVGRN
ncbi:MAG: hypothetical protein WB780_17600 [Candidatus Acidiferrales bacterium]